MRLNTLFKSQQLIFLVASLFFGLLTLWIFGDLASPILISIVLAVLFRPVNTYFTKIGIPRKISVFITFLIVMLLASAFLLLFVPLFINETEAFIEDIPSLLFILEPVTQALGSLNAPIESIESAQSLLSDLSGFLTGAVRLLNFTRSPRGLRPPWKSSKNTHIPKAPKPLETQALPHPKPNHPNP